MKVLFLDIDGVLNCELFYRNRSDTTAGSLGYPLSELCPVRIQLLNHICDSTGCKVVLSSSWRHGRTLEEMNNILAEVGYTGSLYAFTPNLQHSTCGSWVERGNEILKWLRDNNLYRHDEYLRVNHNYAILDDDTDMLYQQRHNFFHCSPNTGITEEIADAVIQFLNN